MKMLTDRDGDRVELEHHEGAGYVSLRAYQHGEGDEVVVHLTPKQARKAGNALHRYAAEAAAVNR